MAYNSVTQKHPRHRRYRRLRGNIMGKEADYQQQLFDELERAPDGSPILTDFLLYLQTLPSAHPEHVERPHPKDV